MHSKLVVYDFVQAIVRQLLRHPKANGIMDDSIDIARNNVCEMPPNWVATWYVKVTANRAHMCSVIWAERESIISGKSIIQSYIFQCVK